MSAARIVEPVDVFEDRYLGFAPCLPRMPPDQFGFDRLEERLEERLDRRIVVVF